MTIFMAIAFFVAGGVCLTQPRRVVGWLIAKVAKARGKNAPSLEALQNPGLLMFVRIIGFLALINGVMMLFVVSMPVKPI